MSTYILMKFLESAPERYDRGIRILTLGKLDESYDRLVSEVKNGWKVLDIGCGTGALTVRAAKKGATVKGIDVNSGMLEIARRRLEEENLLSKAELCEMGVAELDGEDEEIYDAVVSGLCFSELSEDELGYTLREINRILKPGGLLLVADEAGATGFFSAFNRVLRLPLEAVTWVFTQTTTRAVKDLPGRAERAGLRVESIRLNKTGNFIELKAVKDGGAK